MPEKEEIDPATGKAIKEKIRNDLNPGAGLTHNKGQPKPAPYANGQHVKFLTNCKKQHRDSLDCIERNYQDRAACNDFFQAYKTCRKEENEQRKAANGNSRASGWFW